MPIARMNAAHTVLSGRLYAIGGFHYTPTNKVRTNSVECFDPSTNKWTRVAPLPSSRINAAAHASNGFIYVIGGIEDDDDDDMSRIIDKYDPRTNSWTRVSTYLQYNLIIFNRRQFYVKFFSLGISRWSFHILLQRIGLRLASVRTNGYILLVVAAIQKIIRIS